MIGPAVARADDVFGTRTVPGSTVRNGRCGADAVLDAGRDGGVPADYRPARDGDRPGDRGPARRDTGRLLSGSRQPAPAAHLASADAALLPRPVRRPDVRGGQRRAPR